MADPDDNIGPCGLFRACCCICDIFCCNAYGFDPEDGSNACDSCWIRCGNSCRNTVGRCCCCPATG